MQMQLKEVDRVEITTVVDNVSDLLAMDSNEIVQRVQLVKDGRMEQDQVLAEHGFSALIQSWSGDQTHTVLLDAGLSLIAVPFNLRTLKVDLGRIEALALSHGHLDHFGALLPLLEMLPRKPVPLILHPDAFTTPRYLKFSEDFRVLFPELVRDELTAAGAELVITTEPYLTGGDSILFLGEVERATDFEQGMPICFCEKDGHEQWDPISDDTALVANLKDKGLVIVSGCAHSGIINTLEYARKVTGVEQVHAVIGGFHLNGPSFEPIIERTVGEMRRLAPRYIVPTHCTGEKAVRAFEQAMPEAYIRNLTGTRLTFR
jgi:7,8-dihydropterin-6-yl-methyl-4-(beta-D-ribofuranosyl)aminobenzene 5'-phosphate synthase